MGFSKAETMSAHLLEVRQQLWTRLIEHLRCQGAGVREAGAFLLGHKTDTARIVSDFLPYEQLQADALHDDYVSLSAASFATLWDLCRKNSLTVVADIHTHRFGAGQSPSDRANPMVALPGHVAFIVPHFAQRDAPLHEVGMCVYKGDHKWTTYSASDVARMIRLIADEEPQS